MAHIIIPQPDGKYLLFSTITDTILISDCTKDEITKYELNYLMRLAKATAKHTIKMQFDRLCTSKPRVAYEDAIKMNAENS